MKMIDINAEISLMKSFTHEELCSMYRITLKREQVKDSEYKILKMINNSLAIANEELKYEIESLKDFLKDKQ
jgi:hypothetical protein